MLDPVPPPAPFLQRLVTPLAEVLGLPTLPYHIHEVLFAFIFYQTIQSVISPVASEYLFPNIYPKLNKRTRTNWDVHVVSLVQSCLINTLALWVMFTDEERYEMRFSAVERVYGYTGGCGLIQGLACGYFVWDMVVSTRYIKMFGFGIWMHAATALAVFSLGFRPFVNYYAPVFILYELSSPFLNIHWFCDKLNMTGSRLQWYNGMVLLATFFGCRLVWGTYSSLRVYQDVWHGIHLPMGVGALREVHDTSKSSIFVPRDGQLCSGQTSCLLAQTEVMKFVGDHTESIPVWLAGTYLGCNLVLNSLNFFWFGKMVETVRKRFDKPQDEPKFDKPERRQSIIEEAADELDRGVLSGPRTPMVEKTEADATGHATSATGTRMNLQDWSNEISKRR